MNEQWNQLEQLKRNYLAVQPPEHGVWEECSSEWNRQNANRDNVPQRRWIAGVAAALACRGGPQPEPYSGGLSQRRARHRFPGAGGSPEPVPVRQLGSYEADVKTPPFRGTAAQPRK